MLISGLSLTNKANHKKCKTRNDPIAWLAYLKYESAERFPGHLVFGSALCPISFFFLLQVQIVQFEFSFSLFLKMFKICVLILAFACSLANAQRLVSGTCPTIQSPQDAEFDAHKVDFVLSVFCALYEKIEVNHQLSFFFFVSNSSLGSG